MQLGTVCYMSPERISANKYSLSSDIWSFGLTMLAVSGGTFPLNEGMGYWDLMAVTLISS
jgi:serine/threonine protein kinase